MNNSSSPESIFGAPTSGVPEASSADSPFGMIEIGLLRAYASAQRASAHRASAQKPASASPEVMANPAPAPVSQEWTKLNMAIAGLAAATRSKSEQ